ncbi:MAG: hypothetical protein IIY12_01195 [Clostridia bacterium]|nr:hypothetical protein [Clostridia bacterium]MBQ1965532.1 hypothetical protein [Clostridia bacterium]MBQ5743339.1 hypothetical protein [Clostridia bacterium]
MRKKILLQAFLAEVADDIAASEFFAQLSDEQQHDVVDYVRRSFDEQETLSRSATALNRLRAGRIDFI